MPAAGTSADRGALFAAARTSGEFLSSVSDNASLWQALSRRAAIPDAITRRARQLPGTWHLLVLLEDWCGDAVNTIPVLARLAEQAPQPALRVPRRGEHLTLMDQHLTNGKRAIPTGACCRPPSRVAGSAAALNPPSAGTVPFRP